MRKFNPALIFITVTIAFFFNRSYCQIINGNCFIKGQYVELGIGPCGTFGTSIDAPPGYHPRGGTSGNALKLGFIADQGKDGWSIGSPNYCGDYYVPGLPEEGWGISINGINYNNNLLCGISDITGRVTEYRNDGSGIAGLWEGNKNNLEIKAKTTVPINKLYFLTEVTLKNNGTDTIKNVYYMRNIDPDNEVTLTSDYVTKNTIISQNPNIDNKAVVSAEGLRFGCFIALGTRDCRAKVSYGGFSNRNAAGAWNCESPHQCSGTNTFDEAITLSFNLGDLAPNQQTSFKFVNVLNLADLDEAVDLTGPSFLIGNTDEINSGDTALICSSGPTIFEVINTGGFDNWTWTPATALNTTTGPVVICSGNLDTLEYTATGINSCGGSISIFFTAIKGVITNVPKAGPINGALDFCLPNTTTTFSIAPIPRAKKYKWFVPDGTSVLAGDGTRSITVDVGTEIKYDSIFVCGINVCGPGDTSMIRISVCNCNFIYPVTPATTFFCPGDSVIIKTDNIPGASYTWYRNNIAIPNSDSFQINTKDTGFYYAAIAVNDFCNNVTQKARVNFTVPPAVILSPPGKVFKCTGLPVTLSASIIANAPGRVKVDWFKDSLLVAADNGITYTTINDGVYYAKVTNSYQCKTTSPFDTVISYKLPSVLYYSLTGDSIACEGKPAIIKAVYNSEDGNIVSYQWYKNGNPIAGATDSILRVLSSANYGVILTSSKGCVNILRDTFLLFNPNPVANFGVPDGCVLNDFTFSDSTSISGGGVTQWIWKKNNIVFSRDQNPVVNFLPGNYQIQLIAVSDVGCTSIPKELPFLRYGKPESDFSITGLCSDSTTILKTIPINAGFGNNNISNWNWDFGNGLISSSPVYALKYDSAGFYTIKLTFSGNNCTAVKDSVVKSVFFGDALQAKRYTNIPVIKNELFTVYGGLDGVRYTWSPPTGLGSPNYKISNGILNQSQQYIIHVVNSYGCGRYDTLLVTVINGCKVFVPTIFSPNNDGINDILRGYFGCLKTLDYFTIYNRWGKLVFSTKISTAGWDGRISGLNQETGTYVWVAEGEFQSGEKFVQKGSFVMIR